MRLFTSPPGSPPLTDAPHGHPQTAQAAQPLLCLSRQGFITAAGALLVYTVALCVRLADLDDSRALADSIGPFLAAAARPFSSRQHAPLYGWALSLPYVLGITLSDSLRGIYTLLASFHAGLAPLTYLASRRLSPGKHGLPLLLGMLVALEPGLLDSTRSGAEGYLASFWVGVMTVGIVSPRAWGPPLALVSAAFALMNHPLAVCVLPLLESLPWRQRQTQVSAAASLLMLLPSFYHLLASPLTTSGGAPGSPLEALSVFFSEGLPLSPLVLLAPVAGLLQPQSRGLAIRLLLSGALLWLLGGSLEYLREYHLRILEVPAVVCLAALSPRLGLVATPLLMAAALTLPVRPQDPRPGSLAMTEAMVERLTSLPLEGSIVVDRLWLSGPPCAEPSALMLELFLQPQSHMSLSPGGRVALVVSANPARGPTSLELEALSRLKRHPGITSLEPAELGIAGGLDRRPRCGLVVGPASALRAATAEVCPLHPRFGGAWDGLAPLRPETRLEELDGWWAPCLFTKH